MTFEQFKKILNLSERLTDIQYSVSTRQEVMDLCNEFFDDSIQYGTDDDHYYAILKDGSFASDHDGGCKQSSLKTAKKITFTSGWGTVWFFGREAQKDEQLLDDDSVEFFEDVESWYDVELDGVKIGSCIVMEYHDETALLERLDIDEQHRCKGYGTEAIEVLKRIRCQKDGALYCAAESDRCSHLYDRIGRQTSEAPWCSLDQGFGVFCLG